MGLVLGSMMPRWIWLIGNRSTIGLVERGPTWPGPAGSAAGQGGGGAETRFGGGTQAHRGIRFVGGFQRTAANQAPVIHTGYKTLYFQCVQFQGHDLTPKGKKIKQYLEDHIIIRKIT